MRIATLLLLVALVGCFGRDDPEPTEFLFRVEATGEAPRPGAALVFLAGEAITDVEGEPGTRLWWNPVPGEGGARVVLVGLSPGTELAFRVRVPEGTGAVPQGTLLSLAGEENQRLGLEDAYRIRIVR